MNREKKAVMDAGNAPRGSKYNQFCFTYAIDGGAWIIKRGETQANWLSYSQIERQMGKGWFERMRSKQGMFTGCWVSEGNEVS